MPIHTTAIAKPWDVEVPCSTPDEPALLYQDGELWVAYVNDDDEGLHTVIRFRGVIEHRLSAGVLRDLCRRNPGLSPAANAVNEIFGSDVVEQNTFRSSAGVVIMQARHWVFTFHDAALEVVARGDTDPLTALRSGHCRDSQLATAITTDIATTSPAEAVVSAFLNYAHREPYTLWDYRNGVVGRVANRVDDESGERPLQHNVPFSGYLEKIARLPLPTKLQIENFCRYVMGAHSWYKGSLLQGRQFSFFINPSITHRQDEQVSNLEEYLETYGYLDYCWGEAELSAPGIPLNVVEQGAVRLYPYMSSQSDAFDLLWYRNIGQINIIKTSEHPDRGLLLALHEKYLDRSSIEAHANALHGAGKIHALRMLRYYKTCVHPLSKYDQKEKESYETSIDEIEMGRLQESCDCIDEAITKERAIYESLRLIEAEKILAKLRSLGLWLRKMPAAEP